MSTKQNVSSRRLCPDCGTRQPFDWKVSHPDLVQPLYICPNCDTVTDHEGKRLAGSQAEWAEHYEGDILRMPKVEL